MPANSDNPTFAKATEANVGGLSVLRSLPGQFSDSVGPFILLDHFGPVPAFEDALPAHPHAGIEVMTYLISGANEHRDSAGNAGRISSGGAQWMRAGRGILHAEQTIKSGEPFHGLQIWSRLPKHLEDAEPVYQAVAAADMPTVGVAGGKVRVLSGEFRGHVGPVRTALRSILWHVMLEPGARLSLSEEDIPYEFAVYAIDGECVIGMPSSVRLDKGDIAFFTRSPATLSLSTAREHPQQLLILGGERPPLPLIYDGPFVYDNRDSIRAAKSRFTKGEMGTLDGVPF
ncbi:MAG: pirin family protein [Pseudomonadota bacterium]